jgi:hypothetical protein
MRSGSTLSVAHANVAGENALERGPLVVGSAARESCTRCSAAIACVGAEFPQRSFVARPPTERDLGHPIAPVAKDRVDQQREPHSGADSEGDSPQHRATRRERVQ